LSPQPVSSDGLKLQSPNAGPPGPSLRVLALVPDAFGSQGGISKFNRDLLSAVCAHPACTEVVAVPRLMPSEQEALPSKLTWITDGLGGKLRYIRAALKSARGKSPFAPGQPSTPAPQPSTAFDLVICGHINLLPIAFLARRIVRGGSDAQGAPGRLSPPIALFIHGIDVWQPHRSLLVRRLLPRISAFVSVSEFTKQRFLQWSGVSGSKGLLLPNCVDLGGFSPGPKDPLLLNKYGLAGRKVLMTLGRLVRGRPKGIDEVLDTLPTLMDDVSQLSYLICGDGPDRPRLVTKARSLGLTVFDCADNVRLSKPIGIGSQPSTLNLQPPRVVFAGQIAEAEKAAHYRLADAFVMPGYGEGFGIVYLEALACGIPVLGSTLDASQEALLDGQMGLLVDPRNRDELRNGLRQVLQQPRGQVPSALEYFSFPNFVKRCHAIINKLCPAMAASS
jgi:phosphatidyl-myo-inositol dimannoside synthase